MPIRPKLAFLLCFATLLLFPEWHLTYFAPYLIVSFYHWSRFQVLWAAILAGTLLDLFSGHPFFGLYAINFTILSFALYPLRRQFFADKIFTLPLMTFFFAILSTLLTLLLALFYTPLPLNLRWVVTDLLCMSLIDSLYAALIILPFQITLILRRVWLMRGLNR